MYIPVTATLKLMMKTVFFIVALHFIVYLDRNSFCLRLPNCPDQMCIKICMLKLFAA